MEAFWKWVGRVVLTKNLYVWLWPSVGGPVTFVAVYLWSRAQHLVGPEIFTLALVCGFITSLIPLIYSKLRDLFIPRISVALTPTSGNSSNIELRVTNKGKLHKFYAECKPITLRFGANPLGQRSAVLKWEGTSDKRLTLEKNESGLVEVAAFDLDHARDFGEVRLMGLKDSKSVPFEWSRWNLGNRENPPEYDVQISIFADGTRFPKRQTFTVRPMHPYGPLEMVEVTA